VTLSKYIPKQLHSVLAIEVACLFLAMPTIYFPNAFPTWTIAVGFVLLFAGLVWRRRRLGLWRVQTPADWPLILLFLVMLPISVVVAPPLLREAYSIPRAVILIWNFCLFSLAVTYVSQSPTLLNGFAGFLIAITSLIAMLAPLGIKWVEKAPGMAYAFTVIPSPLIGVFRGAESGFSPNQVAGAILCAFPLTVALASASIVRRRISIWQMLLLLSVVCMGLVLMLTQSRAGLLGASMGLVGMGLLTQRWGRWTLAGLSSVVLLTAPLWFQLLDGYDGRLPVDSIVAIDSFVSRQEIWNRAYAGISDFALTGMGLGTFRSVVWLLYPLFLTPTGYDIAHAHNLFLQQALDFGLPGLVALVAAYLIVWVQIISIYRAGKRWRVWSYGFAGCLISQTIYSQFDVVAMGSKPNFLFWLLLALILGCANLVRLQAHECPCGHASSQ
jgi:putative inorganic carbon (hco3(-)) transporter